MNGLLFLLFSASAATPATPASTQLTDAVTESEDEVESTSFTAMEWEQSRCEAMQGLFEVRAELHDVRLELSAAASRPKIHASELRLSDVIASADDGTRLTELLEREGDLLRQQTAAEVGYIRLTSVRIPSTHTLAWCQAQTWEATE